MRIVEINMMHIGSTGKIMFGIADMAKERGYEVFTFSPYYYRKNQKMDTETIKNHTFFGSLFETKLHILLAEMTGMHGIWSYFGTRQLIKKIKKLKPDILHLHNLHNFTINIPKLFSYIKKNQIKTVWTLHDCWSMTGKCPHFENIKCQKWKTGCYQCPSIHEYPKAYVDQVRLMWKLKRKWFSGIEHMVIVTPSEWLAGVVKQSYLSNYQTKVIHNGIDLNIFKPTQSDIRIRYGIEHDRYIILGVSFDWDIKKGVDVFIHLSNRLSRRYQIILVGTNTELDEKLPNSIVSIHRTHNQKELAELYSAADVFVNPTREDTFPTVNIEALACGTPVITFRTGGSSEGIDSSCGICIEQNDLQSLERNINLICEKRMFSSYDCVGRAKLFEMNQCFREYIDLYENIY